MRARGVIEVPCRRSGHMGGAGPAAACWLPGWELEAGAGARGGGGGLGGVADDRAVDVDLD